MGFSAKRPSSFNSFRMSQTWLLRQNYIEEIIIYCLKYADYAIQYLNGRFKRGGLRVCKSFVSSHCTLSLLIPWQLFWIALPTVCISHAKYLHRLNVSESLWYAPDLLRPPPPRQETSWRRRSSFFCIQTNGDSLLPLLLKMWPGWWENVSALYCCSS